MPAVEYREIVTRLTSDELYHERGSVRESSLADALMPASRAILGSRRLLVYTSVCALDQVVSACVVRNCYCGHALVGFVNSELLAASWYTFRLLTQKLEIHHAVTPQHVLTSSKTFKASGLDA